MGAPNLVRGGSHSGNVATAELARAGLLDMLSSDYVPASLLDGGAAAARRRARHRRCRRRCAPSPRPPAEAVGLDDRGEIAVGKRADLVRVEVVDAIPVVRSVWRAGQRVA